MHTTRILICLSLAATATCAQAVDNSSLPEPVRVPDGHVQKTWSKGVGEVTYACRQKVDQPGSHSWIFVAPSATLFDGNKKPHGNYYGGPTWESSDGSKTTGTQVAIAPTTAGNLPLQLIKATSTSSAGMFANITYIQRLNTVGGAAPASPCDASNVGQEQKVAYQADYIYYVAR